MCSTLINCGIQAKHFGKNRRMNNELKINSSYIIKGMGTLNNKFSGKKILITGSAGFLGCQFMHYFKLLNDLKKLDKPCQVFAWDNYIRGVPLWLKDMMSNENIFVQEKDIIKDTDYPKIDMIIHAASIASPIFYRKYPIETIEANIIGLKNLLDFSKSNDIKEFLFFSTSEIYGDPDVSNIPTKEDYRGYVSCTGPRACYDESKRLGETLCVNYFQKYNVPVKIVRPFNNYGPGLKIDDKRVIPDFFNDVLNNKDLIIHSDGLATRTFCYISDAIEGYLRAFLSGYNGESFNIGSDSPEISIKELGDLIIKISGKNLKLIFQESSDLNYLTDNPQRRCPSIDKAKSLLGYSPKISLESGLKKTFNYYLSL